MKLPLPIVRAALTTDGQTLRRWTRTKPWGDVRESLILLIARLVEEDAKKPEITPRAQRS